MRQRSEARFNTVASNRFYYALSFRDHYKVAFDNLEAATKVTGKEQAQYLVVTLSGLGDVKDSMGDYIRFDEQRRPKAFLSGDKRGLLHALMAQATMLTTELLQCVISQI